MSKRTYETIPQVSVVLPVYNSEKYLTKCLESVMNQTLKNIEIICVNDGSTDKSLEILRKFSEKDKRFIILDEPNSGAGISRKKGIDISKGEYIFLADSDDILEKDLLKSTYENGIHNNSDLVLFKIHYFDSDYKTNIIPEKFDLTPYFYENIDFNNTYFDWRAIKPVILNKFTNIWNRLYKGDFLRENDFYFPEKLSFNDVPLHVQSLILAKRITFVPKILYNYRLDNENSITVNTHTNKKVFDIFKITKFIDEFLLNEHLINQFRMELINFKIDHYIYHLNSITNEKVAEEFFQNLKIEFENFNLKKSEFNNLKQDFKVIYLSVIDSNSFNEYKILKTKYLSELREFNESSKNIKVSVIIPVYNVSNFLPKCLDSVINQTLKDIEIICVNDGSYDNSRNILKKYAEDDSRFKIIDQKNCGLGCARNTGMKYATGDFIFFLDSDDYILPDTLEKLYENALSNNSDMVLFKIARFDDSFMYYNNLGFPLEKYFKNVNFNNFIFTYENIKSHVLNASFSAWSKLYKREFLNNYDDFKFPLGIAYEDVLFHVKCMLRASRLSFVPEFMYYYRISNTNSIMHNSSNIFDIFEVCNSVEKFLKDYDYFNIFFNEFIQFKVRQLSQYIALSESEEYFNLVVNEFKGMNLKVEDIPNNVKNIYTNVLNSNSYDDYKLMCNNQNVIKNIKISVIIPVYNVENYLKECLDSIINQTLNDLEIICINDGSTDNSLKILQDYGETDDRILIVNQENNGAGAARNVGLNYSKGEYIHFMDADDYLELTAYEELYDIAHKNSLDMVIFKLINFYDENGEKFQSDYYDMKFLKEIVDNKIFNYEDIGDKLFSIAVSPPGKLFKNELIRGMKFPENVIFEDNPFFTESIFKAKKVYFYDKYLYNRRIRNNSVMSSNFSNFKDSIYIHNLIFKITKDFGHFDEFANILYYRKIKSTLSRYNSLDEEYKEDFFEELKADFVSNRDSYENDPNFNNLNKELKNVFYSCISSDSYKEFDVQLQIYDLQMELNNLKSSNVDLNQKCLSLENNNQNLQKELDALNSSNVDLNQKCLSLENNNQNLQNELNKLNFKKIKLEESNNYLKNKNRKLSIENDDFKSRKNYKFRIKYNEIKNKFVR